MRAVAAAGRRPQISRAGDTFIVTKLDRLARYVRGVYQIADDLAAREVKLSIGSSVCDPTGPIGKLLFNVLAMVAEFEGDLIRLRTKEGMRIAKAKGRLRGEKPKLPPKQEALLVQLHGNGEHTMSELAELFSVGRSTVYRALDRSRVKQAAAAGKDPKQKG